MKRNTQTELVEYLKVNPCKTEKELVNKLWNSSYRDKKHADLLRRALFSGKITRVRIKLKNIDKRMVYRYYVPK
jgi:hypothetical protein